MSEITLTPSRKSRKVTLDPRKGDENSRLLASISSEFNIVEASEYAELVNYGKHRNEPLHRWFPYREGYSLKLVKEFISKLPKGSIIVDPFCGCGTTLIAAQELGFESYGFDINPMSVLVSRVKTRNYSKKQQDSILLHLDKLISLDVSSPSDAPPSLKIINKVFHPAVLSALLITRRYIKTIEDSFVREFIKVGWLSILESVSNVYKEGNGIKYRNRKRTPTGYVTITDEEWQAKLFPEDKFALVLERLNVQITSMVNDLASRPKRLPKADVIDASAEELNDHLSQNSAAFVIFSPPYCNCFNYFKIFKVELWMGEFVGSYKDMQRLSQRATRSHVETILDREGDEPNEIVDQFVDLIDPANLWDKRIPKAVRGYFIDMKKVLAGIQNVLVPGGGCAVVVGNSAYSGIIVPTDAILASLGRGVGLEVSSIAVARHLTTSSQQKLLLNGVRSYLRESVVFLNKPDPRLEEKELIVVEELPVASSQLVGAVYLIQNNGLTALTHKFHRYPGKFIPHVPRWAVKKHLKKDEPAFVLDPFCGSGTTNVESLLQGHSCFGMDIDNISRLLTKVKTTPIDECLLSNVVSEVLHKIQQKKTAKFRPQIPTLNHWFNNVAILELGIIRDVIDSYSDNKALHDFLKICFIAVIRRASNADNQTMKTYVSHTLIKTPKSAKTLFEQVLPDYAKRLIAFGKEIKPSTKNLVLPYQDARDFADLWQKDEHGLVDLVVTSPPYLKSVDYVYNQMAEYFWIGDLFDMETQPKQNIKKKEYIGTESVMASNYKEFLETGVSSIDDISARIFKKAPKHSYIMSSYFKDMIRHFREVNRVLKPGGHYVLVVGDSLINNEVVNVHQLLQECAGLHGFSVSDILGYEIRNKHMRFPRRGRGGMIRYDWIIDLVSTTSNERAIPLEARTRQPFDA